MSLPDAGEQKLLETLLGIVLDRPQLLEDDLALALDVRLLEGGDEQHRRQEANRSFEIGARHMSVDAE